MKTTIRAVAINLSDNDAEIMDQMLALFSSAVRYSYKRLMEGKKKADIQKSIQAQYGLNSRYASDAIEQARQLKVAQGELLNLQIANWTAKIKAVEQKIKRCKKPEQLSGLEAKLAKRERKLAYWRRFVDAGTLPKIIFGGRRLFKRRAKGEISQEEYRAARDNRLLSRGDATKKGNPNTRLVVEGDKAYLVINTDQFEMHGQVRRYRQIKIEVYLPQKLSKKTGQVNGRNYRQMVLDYLETGAAYQIEIIRQNGQYYCHITIEEPEADVVTTGHQGLIGIDTNPNGLALTLITRNGNFKQSWWIGNGELICSRSHRRRHLIGTVVKEAVTLALNQGVGIAVEDLKFKDDKDLKPKTARKIHNFAYTCLLQGLEREAKRQGAEITKVKPAYTSVIGEVKYKRQFGLTTHGAAAMVIARRAYEFKDKLPRAVKRTLPEKVKSRHHWSQWAAIKKLAAIMKLNERKAGVKPAFTVA